MRPRRRLRPRELLFLTSTILSLGNILPQAPGVVVDAFLSSFHRPPLTQWPCQASFVSSTQQQSGGNNKKKLSRAEVNIYKLHQELQQLKKKKNGASLAEQRLDRAIKLHLVDPSENLLSEVAFNIVIMGYSHQAKRGDATGPSRAEAVLQKMTETAKIPPSTYSYNAVIQAWSQSRLGVRAYKSILRLMECMKKARVEPDTFTYNLLIASNVDEADKWLQEMKNKNIPADRQTYHLLFKSYSQQGNALGAEALIEELSERSKNGEEFLRPHAVWINCIISAWAKVASPQSGKRADWWLKRMQKLYQLGQANMRPDASTFSQVMNVHAMLGHTKRVEELLQDLEHRYAATGEPELQPDTVTYTVAMKVYGKQPEKALRLLHIMQDLHAAGRQNVAPNLVTYNTLIKILASTATRDGLATATEILECTMDVPPNSATYAELIFGWSSSGLREAGYRAEQLLHELEALPPSKQKGVELTKLYNAVILAWGRSGNGEAPRKAEELLRALERKYESGDWKACPNNVTFVSVADSYAKACIPDAQERCEALLQRMESLYQSGIQGLKPTRVLFNSILNALAKSCQPSAVLKAEEILEAMQASDDESLHPDIVTYATIIDCYTKCRGDCSSDRADEILSIVENAYAKKGVSLLKPNAVFYSACMQAYAKTATPHGAEKAEALLRRNEHLYSTGHHEYCKPHAILFNAAIDAVARSGLPDSGQRAEALLQEMEDRYQAGDDSFRVTRRSLNAVLLAYRNDVHGGQKAEFILNRMEELTNAGVYDVMPDLICWNTAIGAIAHSNDPTAAERAQALLDKMEDLFSVNNEALVRPDGITYSYVIGAWLKRNDDKGTKMANRLLEKFFSLADEDDSTLVAAPVLDVIKEYRGEGEDID